MSVRQRTIKSAPRRLRGWEKWPKEKLLDARICDLGLQIKGSALEPRIKQLYRELDKRGFNFHPHFWLSDEWFCPDGVPGVAVPFYLAHPRLRRLEKAFVLEVEGADRSWCMKLLRHETGHALLNAYKLDKRRDWKLHFGKPDTPYPETFSPKPYSKRFVLNLPNWYAQAHPHEDWAETFAVWLKPNSDWRTRYHNWPALKKLEFTNELMAQIREQAPRLRNQRQIAPVEKLRITLREYYQDKIHRYGTDSPEFFDRDLQKLFVSAEDYPRNEQAAHYLRRIKPELLDIIERWTGEYKYRINEVLKDMIERCDKLALCVNRTDEEMEPEMVACLTMLVMNKLHSGGFHISL
jgi:hypothetical protein